MNSYLTATSTGIALASMLIAFAGRHEPAKVVVAAAKADRETISFVGMNGDMFINDEGPSDAAVPDQRRVDDVRPVYGAAPSELPARHSRDQRHSEPVVDPVCGKRGRTWYTKSNGWRYWRCNR
jgi:hypothetical protein